MDPTIYYILHVGSGFLLTAFTFQAFAAPTPERRRATMVLGGAMSLIMVVSGFSLLAKLGYEFETWIFIKIACWLGLAALGGIAFRRPQAAGALSVLAVACVLVALYAVYVLKPL